MTNCLAGTASNTTPLQQPKSLLMPHHHLHSSPETCHWGFFDAQLKPVLTIASGDEVTIETVSGGPEVLPDKSKFHIPPELAEIHAQMRAASCRAIFSPARLRSPAPSRVTCWKSTSSTSSSGRIGAGI